MKIQQTAVLFGLGLVTGCSSIPRLPEPYETRYFTMSNVQQKKNQYGGYDIKLNKDFYALCKDIKFFSAVYHTKENIILSTLLSSNEINADLPYQIVSEKDNFKFLESERDVVQLPTSVLEKCTIGEDVYKKRKAEMERKIAIAKKEAAEKKRRAEQEAAEKKRRAAQGAAEKKRKAEQEAAEKKRRAEQEAAEKEAEEKRRAEAKAAELNKYPVEKYGKPYCNPYTANDILTSLSWTSFFTKEKDCLFKANFTVLQVVSDGMLVTGKLPKSLFEILDGPFFVVKHKDDLDKTDGESIRGLFEYIGIYSYESMAGTKTVLKFKHVE